MEGARPLAGARRHLLVRGAGRAQVPHVPEGAQRVRARAALAQDRAEEEVRDGEGGIEVEGALRLVLRLLVAVQGQEERGPQVVQLGVQGVAAQRGLRDPFRFGGALRVRMPPSPARTPPGPGRARPEAGPGRRGRARGPRPARRVGGAARAGAARPDGAAPARARPVRRGGAGTRGRRASPRLRRGRTRPGAGRRPR